MTEAPSAPTRLVDQLLALSDLSDQRTLLDTYQETMQDSAFADALAEALKERADHFLRVEASRAETLVKLLQHLARLTDNLLYEALSLRAEGNIRGIAQGNFQQAVVCYDGAAAIYHAQKRPLDEAKTQVGKIGCLSHLSRYDEALEVGIWAMQVLREHKAWPLLTGLLSNLGIIYHRLGQGREAATLLAEARDICLQGGADQELAGVEINYAFVLRSLGQLEASIAADQRAYDLFSARGQTIPAARAQASMATTYLFYGRFNEALEQFDQVLAVYTADQRHYDAVLVQLYVTDCLLQLGRFQDVLTRCDHIRPLFSQIGATLDSAKTLLNEAVAYAGLRQYSQALASLDEAKAQFEAEGNMVWAATSDLQRAVIFYRQGNFQASSDIARRCQPVFEVNQLKIQTAQAHLVAARAAIALEQFDNAEAFATAAQDISEGENIARLRHQCHHLLGRLAWRRGRPQAAINEYEQAIIHLERLRGQTMIEFRVDFLTDNQQIYEELVALLLEAGETTLALQYVERAKSRALVEMLAFQLDLHLRPRRDADKALVEDLQHLRDKRNQLMRGWTTSMADDRPAPQEMQQTVQKLEQQLTQHWHTLLIRNADYARDAALTTVRSEPVQPYLDEQTLLIEYFMVAGELVVFLVSGTEVTVQRLAAPMAQIAHPIRLLNLALKAVPTSPPDQLPRLTANTQRQLQQLYQFLVAPFSDYMKAYSKLIIVPHGGLLHYLPFHALYDGEAYLLEHYEIGYLPSASLLHYAATQEKLAAPDLKVATFGYADHNRLPYAPQEAEAVATLLAGEAFLEDRATLAQFQAISQAATVLHLATHGDFNPENPLFSGLTLADGALCTLDIFNLRLRASLVTLSACQTGRSLVAGGDELLGLMRAFLYAGAASLVLSHWRVADQATMHLMEAFYQKLAEGHTKGAALRAAQGDFIGRANHPYAHPYYWASFFLVGDSGPL